MEGQPDRGDPPSDIDWIKDRLEIAAIQTAYGHAADMLSSNPGNPEESRRIFRAIFTEDVVIEAYMPNKDPDAKPALTCIGPDRFVDAALDTFSTGPAYRLRDGDVHGPCRAHAARMENRPAEA